MHSKTNLHLPKTDIDPQYIEEALQGIKEDIVKELVVKPNAFYPPSNERTEEEHLSKIVSGLQTTIDADLLNSKYGKRSSYEEDDLMEYMNDRSLVNAAKLKDKPYFARINYAEEGEKFGNVIYIGEKNIAQTVKSWKYPIAQLYYKKPFHEKIQINQKQVELDMIRELTIEEGKLKKLHPEQRKQVDGDSQLVKKLTEKKGAEMHALIDSLQAEQYELIQLPITEPIVVQGSAGSGKSVIALHRLSYILYNVKHLEANRIAIIGPNNLFLSHIKNVLPELGDQQIVQTTFQNHLEKKLKLKNPVKQIDRMFLSEVLDLGVKEGREQELRDFHNYSKMRKIKGSLEYKNYIENYTQYLVSDLSPFVKNIEHGLFAISGIEISKFIINTEHYGASKQQLKAFITSTFQNKYHTLNQIYQSLSDVTIQQVEQFIEAIKELDLLQVTTEEIKLNKQEVQKLFDQLQRLQMNLKYRLYHKMLSTEQLEEAEKIGNVPLKEAKLKQLANEVIAEVNKQLADCKQRLETMIRELIQQQLQAIVANIERLFVLEKQAMIDIKEQFENYYRLFHQQYILTQATYLLEWKGYLSAQQLQTLLDDLNESFLTDFNDSWASYKTKLSAELHGKLIKELTGRVAEKIEEAILFEHRDLRDIQLFMRRVHTHTTIFGAEKMFEDDYGSILAKVDDYYTHTVEDIYKHIIQDLSSVASTFTTSIDTQLLSQYQTIEKHDLPALYSIHKIIEPQSEKFFQYIIVDEAQDYSLYEMAVLKDITEQIMLMGDLGQNITPGNTLNSWKQFEAVIGPFKYYELKATFRSTRQIVEFANKIIQPFSKDKYNLPQLTFRNGAEVKIITRSGESVYSSILEEIEHILLDSSEQARSVIIAKTQREAKLLANKLNHPDVQLQLGTQMVDAKVVITTPILAKGLEFDHVLLFRFSNYLKTDEYDIKLAYVAASRALHKLYVYS